MQSCQIEADRNCLEKKLKAFLWQLKWLEMGRSDRFVSDVFLLQLFPIHWCLFVHDSLASADRFGGCSGSSGRSGSSRQRMNESGRRDARRQRQPTYQERRTLKKLLLEKLKPNDQGLGLLSRLWQC